MDSSRRVFLMFGRVPLLKTTYTIMKLCSEVSIQGGFHLPKKILKRFDIDFNFLKKIIFFASNFLNKFLDFQQESKNAYEKYFLIPFLKFIMIICWKYLQGMGFHLIITVFHFFTPRHRFSTFEKKFHFWLLKQKYYLSSIFPPFLPISSNVTKPALQVFRAVQTDTFTSPGRFHI